jgi:Protein of unknown function (DUF3145)
VSANGDIMIGENRLRAVMTLAASARGSAQGSAQGGIAACRASLPDAWARGADGDRLGTLKSLHAPRHPALGGSLEEELSLLLGEPWDAELEPFRHASAGAPVRWLHATG